MDDDDRQHDPADRGGPQLLHRLGLEEVQQHGEQDRQAGHDDTLQPALGREAVDLAFHRVLSPERVRERLEHLCEVAADLTADAQCRNDHAEILDRHALLHVRQRFLEIDADALLAKEQLELLRERGLLFLHEAFERDVQARSGPHRARDHREPVRQLLLETAVAPVPCGAVQPVRHEQQHDEHDERELPVAGQDPCRDRNHDHGRDVDVEQFHRVGEREHVGERARRRFRERRLVVRHVLLAAHHQRHHQRRCAAEPQHERNEPKDVSCEVQ